MSWEYYYDERGTRRKRYYDEREEKKKQYEKGKKQLALVAKLFVSTIVGLFLLLWLPQFFSVKETDRMPIITKQAQVSAMREVHHRKSRDNRYVTFRSDGSSLELDVLWSTYEEVSIGDQGVLAYQGTRFISFTHASDEMVIQELATDQDDLNTSSLKMIVSTGMFGGIILIGIFAMLYQRKRLID